MYRTVDNMTMVTGDKVNLAWSFAGKVLPDHKKALPECSFVQLVLPLMKAPAPNIQTAKQSVTWPFFSYVFFTLKAHMLAKQSGCFCLFAYDNIIYLNLLLLFSFLLIIALCISKYIIYLLWGFFWVYFLLLCLFFN